MGEFILTRGDIVECQVDAIVNAWNRNFIPYWLLLPQGVSRAIRKRGGVTILQELQSKHGLLPLGGAVATGAGNLDAKWVIHVAALHAYWMASPFSVGASARSAFALAAEMGVKTLAIPLLGAGTGGLKPHVSLELIREAWEESAQQPEYVNVVVYDKAVYDAL